MGCGITELLDSGNAHAYRWLAEHRPEEADLRKVDVSVLCGTPLFIPALEERQDGSLRAAKLYRLLDELLASGDFDGAKALFRKLRFSEARLRDLEARCGDLEICSLDGSGSFASEFSARIGEARLARTGGAKKRVLGQLFALCRVYYSRQRYLLIQAVLRCTVARVPTKKRGPDDLYIRIMRDDMK